jgi:hypothetical protein
MTDEIGAPPIEGLVSLDVPTELTELSVKERRLGLRVIPYGVVAVHPVWGALAFEQGAFGDIDPREVRLRMDHQDPPTGLGLTADDRPDALYMDFRVSKTQRGDDQLALALDGTSRGVSPGFYEVGQPRLETRDGQRVRVYGPGTARLAEASTTWQPTFVGGAVTHVLSKTEENEVSEETTPAAVPATPPVIQQVGVDYEAMANAIVAAQAAGARDDRVDLLLSRFDEMIELQRSQFNVPAPSDAPKPKLHHWVMVTLRRMAGETIRQDELKALALDDVVTTEQPGLVPTVFTPDYDDLINRDRPFLQSTRQIEAPATGNSMTLPIITTRAVAGTQAGSAEKGALTTTATKVGTGTFNYQSVFGGADISIQMILRSVPGFFDLLTGDIAMAYALDCENKAVDALLAGYTDSASQAHAPANGGTLDPENLSIGSAWTTSITAYKRAPDTMWLSSAAVASFIDAKADGTNAPLYSNLAAAFTVGSGPAGTIQGLRPIYVPALDDESVDVIIGPSRGFVWAEDPARTLQADRPDVAGRDIALAGGIFPAPRFAHAFTVYAIAS